VVLVMHHQTPDSRQPPPPPNTSTAQTHSHQPGPTRAE